MTTPRQTAPGGPKARVRRVAGEEVKTRKRAPRRAGAVETAAEKRRRLLVEQLRALATQSGRAAYDHAPMLTQADVTGLLLGLHVSPPTRQDPKSGDRVVDGRALNAHLRILRALSDAIVRMREERADAPDSIEVRVSVTPSADEPDLPVYADDAEAGEAAARAGDE